ncbi:vicilin-like seed storage protein At4g36700 [Primulina huaijiensis]|uniref:vicilin-like seed storage protein At4g36700 n=1 Tax=Primulina huaijiensis TaxID=1492673 RepID=UPI003CC6EE45
MAKKMNSVFNMLPVLLLVHCCVILPIFSGFSTVACAEEENGDILASGVLVKREDRKALVSSEYGEISAVRMGDEDIGATYLVHFFTLEPNSLFLPVFLHEHMVFYVQRGSGKLSWAEENDSKDIDLRPGDVYRLQAGTVFFIQSNLETEGERQKLRIHAIFADSNDEPRESTTGPYSSIRDMVLGFDKKVLQAAFKVTEELMDELLSGAKPPAIVHGIPRTRNALEMEVRLISGIVRSRGHDIIQVNKKKREKAKLFNLLEDKKDFENDHGWSTTVTGKKLSVLKETNIGLYMVNLTRGSMMGPHWNPVANEIGIVWQGRGIVRIVCSSTANETGCENVRFMVEEGDVFAVSRLHPMAQMAFENDTFVFAGFILQAKRNHPQFFAGQASVLKTLDREVVSISFNVTKATLDQLLAPQRDSVIVGCTSCAEEELRVLEEEMEKEREAARQREEEEARKREEEKARREEEEEKRREEEARKREEEEAKREEEERKRREEEEERQREEAERERQEEEERRQREEEAQRKEEEKAKREEAERERREREEEERRRREEEAREEEEERQREEAERERQKEEEAQRKEEEEAKREEAERERKEEERRRREEEARRQEEEESKRQEEERRRREEEEAEARAREEKEAEREEEKEEEKAREREEEEAWKEEERRRREEEEKGREEEESRWEREEEERREMERARKEAEKREEKEKARQEEEARTEEHKSEEERAAEEERRWEEAEEAESRHGGGGDREQAYKFRLEW